MPVAETARKRASGFHEVGGAWRQCRRGQQRSPRGAVRPGRPALQPGWTRSHLHVRLWARFCL